MQRFSLSQLLHGATIIAAGISSLLGIVVLVGWYTHTAPLIQVLPTFVPMQYNTALGFLLGGVCLFLLLLRHNRAASVTAGIFATIGILTLCEYVFGWDLGIDQLLMKHYITVETSHPGRMAPNTAFSFGLSGIALIIYSEFGQWRRRLSIVGLLSAIIIAFGLIAFSGYITNLETAYGWGNLTRMAVHTAVGFVALGLGIFMMAWQDGIYEKAMIVPTWFAFPVGIGLGTMAVALWQALEVQLDVEYSPLPLVVLGFGLFMAALLTHSLLLRQKLWLRAEELNGINQQLEKEATERKQAEEALQKGHDELEDRVVERTAELDQRVEESEKLTQAMVNLSKDLKASKTHLERTGMELETANKELEAFSYSVSHDLRAPLRAIDGFGGAFMEEYGKQIDDEGKRILEVIRKNTRQMGRLIDDLLTFSRLGRQTLMDSNINMASLTEEVFGELKVLSPGRKLRIRIDGLPDARGDRATVRQVLVNILSNAIKYTGPVETAVIEVAGAVDGSENVYSVKDNGVGFDMKYADKLFQVFQRLHSISDFAGTGVGLALVQRIIHRHGGRVWAEGEVDKGATFYFTLPKNEGGSDGEKN